MSVGQPQAGSSSPTSAETSAPGVYYLAPHADDVVLSCAGQVRSDVEAGRRVTLITVFLSGRDADTRRAEDERAAQVLGCHYLSLDLFDAADRPEVHGRLGVFGAYGPPHLGITSEVVARLLWHIAAPAELYAPLAVGGHIDHRIVHEAARALGYQQRLTLRYYEDQPYSLAPYALGRRLAALEAEPLPMLPGTGRASPSDELRAARDFYRQLPLLKSVLPGLRFFGGHLLARAALIADGTGQRPGVRPQLQAQLREVSAHRPRRTAALAAYASQWPQFASSPAALEAQLHRYGQSLRPPEPADPVPPSTAASYERFWQDQAMGPGTGPQR